MRFLGLLCENKRLKDLPDIADKYFKLYNVLNKEEKIIIISAHELESSEKDEVL
jgi:F0F1-type ATP synthase delta subunit